MNEPYHIQTLFSDLYHGHYWLDVTSQDTMARNTSEQVDETSILNIKV